MYKLIIVTGAPGDRTPKVFDFKSVDAAIAAGEFFYHKYATVSAMVIHDDANAVQKTLWQTGGKEG